MDRKRRITLSLALMAFAIGVFPCSIFTYSIGGHSYFGGNEDWSATDPVMETHPAAGGKFGYVLFGWKSYLPNYVQAGINSEGLCFDWAAVPNQQYIPEPGKKSLDMNFTVDVMKSCKDVDDVVKYVRQYNIPHFAEEHIMFADRHGKSCVIEHCDKETKIIAASGGYQFITNFPLSNPSLGWYPCERYAVMKAFFEEKGSKEGNLAVVLDRVHQEGDYPTIYSYVFDLSAMRMTVFYNHDYRRQKEYSIKELIKKRQYVDIVF